MLTILWKISHGGEQIFEAHGIAKIAVAAQLSDDLDCGGRPHVAFHCLTPVEDDAMAVLPVRTVIDVGDVFVMNGDGKTIATYRFGHPPAL